MATMQLTYSEIRNRVSKFLGTYGSSGPSGEDLTEANAFVKSGYMRFLTAHDWTFRRAYASMTTEADKYIYELPEDFSGIRTPFTFTAQTGYPPIEERDQAEIMELRGYGDNSSYPQYYAIRAGKHDPETGQRYEVIFWPTPQSDYTMFFSYYSMPAMMSNDGDVPMGGAEHSECILKFCLFAAEEESDENLGVQAQAAQMELQSSIRIDGLREPRTLGQMSNNGNLTPWQVARGGTRINNVNYNV